MSRTVIASLVPATLALLAGLAASAQAQVAPSAEPSRVEERFERETITPQPTPEPLVGLRGAQTPPPDAQDRRFTLRAVELEGATAYGDGELASYYDSLIGTEISLLDAYNLARRINERYLRDGYLLTRALLDTPVRDGRVRIRIIEGYVSDVAIQTVGGVELTDSRGLLERLARNIVEERPLNAETLERYILLADDLPGVSARAVMRPVAGKPEATQLALLIGYDRYQGSYRLNNRGTDLQGQIQHELMGTANGIFGTFERTSLRGITASRTEELMFFDLLHEQQLDAEGTTLTLLASHTDSEPGAFLSPLNIESDAQSYVATIEHPFLRSRKENLRARAEISVRNSETDILGIQLSEDRLRVLRLGAAYDIADSYDGVNLIDAELSQGLDLFGASEAGPGRTRIDGEPDFTKIELNLARLQDLGSGFNLLLQGAGQLSFDPLLSAEEFSVGGANFGRAYDPSEISADHGVAGKLELRYGDAAPAGAVYLRDYQLFTYYDIGTVWNKGAPAGVDDRFSLAAFGLGVRANFEHGFSGNLEVGFPLTRDVAIEGNDSPRVFLGLVKRF